jgi:hypothetical protein
VTSLTCTHGIGWEASTGSICTLERTDVSGADAHVPEQNAPFPACGAVRVAVQCVFAGNGSSVGVLPSVVPLVQRR